MEHREEEERAEPFRLGSLEYTDDPSFFGPYLEEALTDSLNTIQLNPTTRKSSVVAASVPRVTTHVPTSRALTKLILPRRNTRAYRRLQAYNLLKENRPFLQRLLSQLFWIVHLNLHRPSDAQTL
jgi:hypothetical protein